MNKLRNKIDNIINNWDCLAVLPNQQVNCILPELYGCIAEDITEETKKIAIEFNKWVESNFYRQPFTQEYSRITNDSTIWPEGFKKVNIEELFDKFIEEYYV